MTAVGVVAEFNPFHNGHRYLLRQAASYGEGVVAVMTGHAAQRGTLTLTDKWSRTRAALENGADLVLELPAPWSSAPAEPFARAGVELLYAFGCRRLVFGSETGDARTLREISDRLSDPLSEAKIHRAMGEGLSYPAALSEVTGLSPDAPNDLLGLEYLRALRERMEWFPVKRTGAGHNGCSLEDSTGSVTSASRIREMILSGADFSPYLPEGKLPEEALICSPDRLDRALLMRLRSLSRSDWITLPDGGDGLGERLFRAAGGAASMESLWFAAKSKRHTLSRIRRVTLAALLGITEEDRAEMPSCLRILGMNERGKELLSGLEPLRTLPCGTSPAKLARLSPTAARVVSLEAAATDLFGLGTERILPVGTDYTHPFILSNSGK